MVTISRQCPLCGKINTVEVKEEDYMDYQNGAFAQDCFPYLTRDEREIIISGICTKCWDVMFKDTEDDGQPPTNEFVGLS